MYFLRQELVCAGLSTSCSNFLKKLLQFSEKVAEKLLQNSKSCPKILLFPTPIVRQWSLNSFILSHADTFGPSYPRTFLFFSAALVYNFLFREILAFSGVLNVAPALAATSQHAIPSELTIMVNS